MNQIDLLVDILLDKNEDGFIFANCSQSAATIWVKRNKFDPEIYHSMVPEAQCEAFWYIQAKKPEWIEKYGLKL